MSIFDKMFKKNKLDEAMDKAFEDFAENNPVKRKAKATINEAGVKITHTLERELYGESKDHSDDHRTVLEDFDSLSADWDSMIDQLAERELGKYKVCPNCGEPAPAALETCPHCNTPLPDITAAFQICPYCGEKNKSLDLYCVKCGKRLDLIAEEDGGKR